MINVLETISYPQDIDNNNRYQAIVAVSSAAAKLTIQQPAVNASASGGPKRVVFEYAVIISNGAAATFTIYQNSTGPATATAGAAVPLNHSQPANANVFTASNITTADAAYTSQVFAAAEGTTVVDLSKFYLGPNIGVNENLTIETASMSGSVMIQWIER